jgi:hypothetical protein
MNELKYINVWPTQCKSIMDKINHWIRVMNSDSLSTLFDLFYNC